MQERDWRAETAERRAAPGTITRSFHAPPRRENGSLPEMSVVPARVRTQAEFGGWDGFDYLNYVAGRNSDSLRYVSPLLSDGIWRRKVTHLD